MFVCVCVDAAAKLASARGGNYRIQGKTGKTKSIIMRLTLTSVCVCV